MERITEPRAMQAWAERRRIAGERIALVPTMGALHEGHLELVRRASSLAHSVVVSIFVNPIQFDRRDDFDAYPSSIEDDVAALTTAGVAALYTPDAAGMYPDGFQTAVSVEQITASLCGAHRPGHFRGVTTVVTKLLHAVRPHVALFGEKDYQQLVTIQRMVRDLDFGIDIVGVPTVREADGVALSSRNQRLGPREREAARCVPRALQAASAAAAAGERRRDALLGVIEREVAAEPLARLEYAELGRPDTLEPLDALDGEGRLLVAVWVGEVRLIDNCAIAGGQATATGLNRTSGRPVRGAEVQTKGAVT